MKSTAKQQADKLGLDYFGFGRYGKNGITTHISKQGKQLVAVKQQKKPVVTGVKKNGTSVQQKTKNASEKKSKFNIKSVIQGMNGTIHPETTEFVDDGYVSNKLRDTQKDFKRWGPHLNEDATNHAKLIHSNPEVNDSVTFWASDSSAWQADEERRKKLFDTLDSAINKNGLSVREVGYAYRGMHFDGKTKDSVKQTVLTSIKKGGTLKLPPSGFSTSVDVASGFSVDSEGHQSEHNLNVVFRVRPKTGTAITGLAIWKHKSIKGSWVAEEKEIITGSGEYLVEDVQAYPYKGDNNGTILIVDIIQNNSMNESKETEVQQKLISVLFGDSMRNTQKNIKAKMSDAKTLKEAATNYKVSRDISDAILKKMGYTFDPNEFHVGMNVELEHHDVTNGNVVTTAKITAAHLRENPKYYTLLKKHVEK